MNIRVFDRSTELHAIQVTATLYIITEPVCAHFLTASRSIQLMLKTIRFAALGREEANNRGKPITGENPTMWHMFAINKATSVLFFIIHRGLFYVKPKLVYLM